jgi:hypothetical protein
MSDITELPDMGKWFRALLDAFDALKAQAKELEEFRDTASKHMSFWINLHQKQSARIAELEAALRPFADEADNWKTFDSAEPLVEDFLDLTQPSQITVADLRAARAALKGEN